MKSIYLDVCALCRPFDDQSYARIRLETEAVNLILANIYKREYILLYSPVHTLEIESISDWSEQKQIQMLLSQYAQPINTDLGIVRQQTDA
jgi:hypothetical protein